VPAFDVAYKSCLNPMHWPISKKVAAGPIIVFALLGVLAFCGWSLAEQHQNFISKTHKDYAAYKETTSELPHLLLNIQKNLYKLTVWKQINVQGAEWNSTLSSIESDVDRLQGMLTELDGQHAINPLKQTIERYQRSINQTLVMINRSSRVGAIATRALEDNYIEVDTMVNDLVTSAETSFEQRLQETRNSWKRLIIMFLTMAGALGILIMLLGLGTDRMVAHPIKALARVVDRFREGDLEAEVTWTTRKDEIGLVARAMEAFRANLIRNKILERERQELNQELERKVDERTQQLAEQKERLAQALEKEHHLNGLQRQFVSMVCHEFRTPLAIIDGNAHRIIRRHDSLSPDRLLAALGKVRLSVTRLTELMESVLCSSKLEAGAIEMELAPSDLAEMISEITNNYKEVNPTYDIKADVAGLPESFTVDVKLIRQVVSNLLSNAIKYSPDGTFVGIEARSCDDGGVEIAIRDKGVGIPANELEKLFERFFRASTSTGIAGTGIGLHMVKSLVDMHDGQITLESTVGVGTTFRVYLPYREIDEALDQAETVSAA